MIVVTTPAGTIGSEVLRLLIQLQPALLFRAVTRDPEKLKRVSGSEIECIRLDFQDRSTWDAALEGISILFLVVPIPNPKIIRSVMIPFVEAAKKAGCQHVIYISVPGADRFKIIPHYRMERGIEKAGIAYTFLRPSYFMQNLCGKTSLHGVDIATHHEIFIPAGKGKISFIDARDVAAAVVAVCADPVQHVGKSYKLTGSQMLDLYEVADIFTQVMGYPIRYVSPSPWRFWARIQKRHIESGLVFVMIIEYLLMRIGRVPSLSDDLVKLLNRPAISMARFVTDYKNRWITQKWV